MDSLLFSPFQLRGVALKNRVVMSPMCMYSSRDGLPSDFHVTHYASRALGGVGLVVLEATAVVPEGRITPQDMGLWSDEHIPPLRRLSAAIRDAGAVPGIQLAHAGRKASTYRPWDERNGQVAVADGGWVPVAPSAKPFNPTDVTPTALDFAGIEGIVAAFAAAARRAVEAEFEVIELHAAHGYLVNQFLSPHANARTDEYGGSFENRSRLALQVARAIREAIPATMPLLARLSVTEWVDGGWTTEDSVLLARELQDAGVDLIDCSSGGVIPGVKISLTPGYQAPLAERLRREAGIPTGAVGLITTGEQAEQILRANQADLIFLARELLRDPNWALHAASNIGADVPWPAQYARAKL